MLDFDDDTMERDKVRSKEWLDQSKSVRLRQVNLDRLWCSYL